MRSRSRHDAGFTLVEVLLAVAILGIGVVAVVGGMMTSIKVSAQGQSAAQLQTSLRNYAEAVTKAAYADCGALSPSPYTPAATSFTVPSGLTSTSTLQRWIPAGVTGVFSSATTPACTTPDAGIQKLTLTLTAADGSSQSLRLVKRRLT